ncbi:YdcF family protein [Pseudarthrobacter enclensis]|uniref:YdcF family protein n=1 Tax=Pseudarthrobacter enclensis TaxID=993070 RepID=UPI003441036E
MHLETNALISSTARWLTIAGGGFALWLLVALQLFVNVAPASERRSDAVIMLGGLSEDRLPAALRLQKELQIPVLVVSETGLKGNVSADALCDAAQFPSPDLLCFRPEPMNTRGEATAIANLVAHNHWNSVTVVTSNFHVTRAGLLIRQCTAADITMSPVSASMTPFEWLARLVVETGGSLDALLKPQC